MTGAYLRAQAPDGTWGPVEVEHLTPAQRREYLQARSPEELMRWMDVLCDTIVELEKAFKPEDKKS